MANDNPHPSVAVADPTQHPHFDRASSASSSSNSSTGYNPDNNEPRIHAPTPIRPRLQSRRSSGPLAVPRDSSEVGPIDIKFDPDDVRAMSPRRTSQDIEAMGREARDELKRHAHALQQGLLMIVGRIEAVREEHDKLDNHNKFLQKYIGDLMSTSKITATGGRGKK